MADAFDELKEETITPELQGKGTESSIPAATNNNTSAGAEAYNGPVSENTLSTTDKNKRQRSPKDGYRWLVSAGIVLAITMLVIISMAKIVFGIQSAPEIARFYIKTPDVSHMEQLNGFGWNMFIVGKRNLRFYTKEPVESTRPERLTRYTSKDKGFQAKLEMMEALYPDDKKDLEEHKQAIEIWDRTEEETLLHDRVTGLYLLNVEVG